MHVTARGGCANTLIRESARKVDFGRRGPWGGVGWANKSPATPGNRTRVRNKPNNHLAIYTEISCAVQEDTDSDIINIIIDIAPGFSELFRPSNGMY